PRPGSAESTRQVPARSLRQSPCRRACRNCLRCGSPPTTRSRPCRARTPPRRRRDAWPELSCTRWFSCGGPEELLGQEQDERALLQPMPFVSIRNARDLLLLVDDLERIIV